MANGTTKWIIGITASIVVAVTGWGVSAVLATKNVQAEKICSDVESLKTYAVSNDKRITRLETQYDNIMSGIAEIKTRLKENSIR